MIKESVKVHGQYQLEIKQKVSFDRRAHEVRYRIETWFFLPAALQVNPDFYSPKYFQQSLKNYVRLRPPTRKLSQLLEPDEMLAELAAFLATTPDKQGLEPYENTLKRYALTYKRALRLAVKWMERNAQKRSADAITELLAEIHDVLAAYRALSPLASVTGSILMVGADALARSLIPRTEIPVGLIIALIGAPVFVYLIVKRNYSFGSRE